MKPSSRTASTYSHAAIRVCVVSTTSITGYVVDISSRKMPPQDVSSVSPSQYRCDVPDGSTISTRCTKPDAWLGLAASHTRSELTYSAVSKPSVSVCASVFNEAGAHERPALVLQKPSSHDGAPVACEAK